MIHAFALEPELVATWGRRQEFRFVYDKFGIGTPRALLELPAFSEWKDAVYLAASSLELTGKDWKRLEELFKLFSTHRCRRSGYSCEDDLDWLENAEHEHRREEFRAIVAEANPRGYPAVVISEDLGAAKAHLWFCESACTPVRTPEGLAGSLEAMLLNSSTLHLVDPYFGPDSPGHRRVLLALINVFSKSRIGPSTLRVHCSFNEGFELSDFEAKAAEMASRIPTGVSVDFVRLRNRQGGEKLHNRYVLTDLGGVAIGGGFNAESPGETDDLNLLSRDQYALRWSQYVGNPPAFEQVDSPQRVIGAKAR